MRIRYFADLHYSEDVRDMALDAERAAFFSSALDAFSAPGADLLVSLGDVSTTSRPESMRHVHDALERAPFPVHYVYGNHDTMFVNEAHMDQIFGRTADYSFDQGGVHFVVIDTTKPFPRSIDEWGGHVSTSQLEWLGSEVRSAQGRPLVVMGHHALSGTMSFIDDDIEKAYVDNSAEVLEVLGSHVGGAGIYLCGHTHHNAYGTLGAWHFIMLADVPATAGYLELDFKPSCAEVAYRHFDDAEEHPFSQGLPLYQAHTRTHAESGCTFENVVIPL